MLLEGQSASMSMVLQHDESRRARAPPPWNKVNNLWPWPGMNKRCDNTNKNSAYQIAGKRAADGQDVVCLCTMEMGLALVAWPSQLAAGARADTATHHSPCQVQHCAVCPFATPALTLSS